MSLSTPSRPRLEVRNGVERERDVGYIFLLLLFRRSREGKGSAKLLSFAFFLLLFAFWLPLFSLSCSREFTVFNSPLSFPNLHNNNNNNNKSKTTTTTEIMAFSGPAPEALNGRLCMLGLLSGVAAELATGKSVPEQFSQEPTLVVATALVLAAATFAPLISNVDVVAPAGFVRNFFTEKAETANGRAAMVGFGSLLLIEAVKGSALF